MRNAKSFSDSVICLTSFALSYIIINQCDKAIKQTCPQFPESPQPQVIYAERKREKQELTSIQILGIIFEITGVALALMGLIGEERILILDALPPVILGFPLLLTKKHPRLTLIWSQAGCCASAPSG